MAASKTSPTRSSAAKTYDAELVLGSASIQPAGSHGSAAPAGTLHLVAGWEPLCGTERVRFVFPGRRPAGNDTCPACVQASVPKPRPATRPAPRSRARAS